MTRDEDNHYSMENYGTFGLYSFFLLTVICLSTASLCNLQLYIIPFLGARTGHWCRDPPDDNTSQTLIELANFTGLTDQYHTTLQAVPKSHIDIDDVFGCDGTDAKSCRFGFEYDTSVRRTTYIMEWDLVCESSWLSDLVIPTSMLGNFLGSLVCGHLSNAIGRKRILLWIMGVLTVTGVATAFSLNIAMLIVVRFVLSAAAIGLQLIAFVHGAELCSSQQRSVSGMVHGFFYSLGVPLTALFAYFILEWRALQLAISLAGIPLMVMFKLLVPESPRWLVWQGRREEAMAILCTMARRNRKEISVSLRERLYNTMEGGEDITQQTYQENPYRKIVENPVTLRCCLIVNLGWIASSFMVYAVSYNVDILSGNIYLNMCIFGPLEIIARLGILMVLNRGFGRVSTLNFIYVMTIAAGVLGIGASLAEGLGMLVTTAAILIRCAGSALDVAFFVIIVEYFPTSIRGPVSGLASSMSFGFTVMAPYVAGPMTILWAPGPYVIYVLLTIITLVLTLLWLPEIKGCPIPRCIDDLERLKSQTYFFSCGNRGQYKPLP